MINHLYEGAMPIFPKCRMFMAFFLPIRERRPSRQWPQGRRGYAHVEELNVF
jgi:hypothetical protein